MKVKKPQPMESESKTPAPVLNKTAFKNKAKKEKPPKTGVKGAGTLTSNLLDAAASTLATATPAERAERLALAKARRAKKRNKNKAAAGATPKKTKSEKKAKKTKEPAAVDETKPVVPLSQEMKAKIEERKAKKMEKRRRQKEKKLVAGNSVKEANTKKLKAKKGPLAAKIDALQEKFSKQREKNKAWKLQKKTKSKAGNATPVAPSAVRTQEEKNKKRNLKKKQRLARRKAEGAVAVFKPRKGRKGKGDKAEAMME